MRVLIIGSGGREHALAWKIKQSPLCSALYVAPGNAGTAEMATNIPLNPMQPDEVAAAVQEHFVEFVLIAPEDPLAAGLADYLLDYDFGRKVSILGPTRAGAQLEASKDFSKRFMLRNGVPTAQARTFGQHQQQEAQEYIYSRPLPIVIKADGLAAGKGVAVCDTYQEALGFLNGIWEENRFGASGDKVLVEDFLKGIECSVFVLTDGKDYIVLPPAKDYKRVAEGDTGPNTGGMGTVSPPLFADKAFMDRVEQQVIKPTLAGLQKEGIAYRGFIFLGLMNDSGQPSVVEYNVRLGDPETQVVLPGVAEDLLPLLVKAADGTMGETRHARPVPGVRLCVVACSEGYPGAVEKGKEIQISNLPSDVLLFHAGTAIREGKPVTNGGRVLGIVAQGNNVQQARQNAYFAVQNVAFVGMHFRRDIGKDLL